jgi:hypothetical protein
VYTTGEIVDEWIGFPLDSDSSLCKLVLHSNLTGTLTMAGESGVYHYAVSHWNVTNNIHMKCIIGGVTNPSQPGEMTAQIQKNSLVATLTSVRISGAEGWRSRIMFRRSKDLRWLDDKGTMEKKDR